MGDYEWKQAAGKVPVQYLNSTVDFNAWRAALRRLTGSCGMSQALMYSVPADQLDSFKERLGKIVIKKEDAENADAQQDEEEDLNNGFPSSTSLLTSL